MVGKRACTFINWVFRLKSTRGHRKVSLGKGSSILLHDCQINYQFRYDVWTKQGSFIGIRDGQTKHEIRHPKHFLYLTFPSIESAIVRNDPWNLIEIESKFFLLFCFAFTLNEELLSIKCFDIKGYKLGSMRREENIWSIAWMGELCGKENWTKNCTIVSLKFIEVSAKSDAKLRNCILMEKMLRCENGSKLHADKDRDFIASGIKTQWVPSSFEGTGFNPSRREIFPKNCNPVDMKKIFL